MTLRAPARAHIAVNDSPIEPCPITSTSLPSIVPICWHEYSTVPDGWHITQLVRSPWSGSAAIRPSSPLMYSTSPPLVLGPGSTITRCPTENLSERLSTMVPAALVAGSADSHRVLFFRMDGSVGVADVAAADRPCFKLDETFAVNYFGDIDIFDLKSFGARNSCCSHGVVTVPPKGAVPMATIGVSFEMPHYTMPQPPH